MASISAPPARPSIKSRVFPSRTEVQMSSSSSVTPVSENVMNRSANACISVSVPTCSGRRDSQKAPIRSRIVSSP